MKRTFWTNSVTLLAMIAVVFGTGWAVRRFHRPGQLDVVTAQAMDMSAMRPPTGAAPVAVATVRRGSLEDMVTYTGSVVAYNEQDISPRITGRILALTVYPGDTVRAGQVIAQLDTAEVGAKADQAAQEARQAQIGAQVAHLTHHLHHQAALDQASAQVQVAQQGVSDAQAEALADQAAIADAQAGVQSAQASADYWKTERPREKQLADAGAVSQQEYQNELSQAQASDAALNQAQAKASQSRATVQADRTKVQMARRQVLVAQAGVRMAQADIAVAQGQAVQAEAGASAARAAAQEAAVVAGYARIQAPISGVVTARLIASGTLVQPGMTILRIAEIDRVRVQAHVAASDLGGIHPGTPIQITFQGDTIRPLDARISAVFPAASDETRTAIVEAVIPNPGHRLLPGGFATMKIARSTALEKLLVPASAVISQDGNSYVWLALSDQTAHRIAVQAGASDGVWTEIASASISTGSRVVTHGQAGLVDGAALVATAWGVDGPKSLLAPASAAQGETRYRCEKCGMIYSAADARRSRFIDPMDGGNLVPVKGQ